MGWDIAHSELPTEVVTGYHTLISLRNSDSIAAHLFGRHVGDVEIIEQLAF